MVSSERDCLWDAHVHLPAYPDPGGVVAAAKKRGMRLISVGVSSAEAAPSLGLRASEPSTVKCFMGIHPSESASDSGGLKALSPLWEAADGVGEVGLDPKYSPVEAGSAQMELFRAQVEIAARLAKPIQVHSREAETACLDVLEGYSLGAVLMHWFEGEESLGRVLSRHRTFVSFGPAILYSKKLQRMARRCPPEAVLAESDGPVAFGALGGAEGPGLVPSVAFKLGELWGRRFEDVVRQLALNAEGYLE